MADPFDMLGLEPRFDLESGVIRRAYLARVAMVHPDAARGDDLRSTAELNLAKQVLEDPERRANLLLSRLGGPSKEGDKSLPDGFLAGTMEMRERIEEALATDESGSRERVQAEAIELRAGHVRRVSDLFRSAISSPSEATLRSIRMELNAWRYIERLIEQLDPSYDPGTADFKP